ncbi:MAG: hypothetical protein NT051_05830 [Candidatus Micrarchaeota archaeon]|nr:hypothetical protein [Candidatus Micrarchaeota archaeon]
MRFSASAPCKAILFGEHYVVYGAPALAIPIEPRNSVRFSSFGGNGIALNSSIGKGLILPDGGFSGCRQLKVFSAVATDACRLAKKPLPICQAKFLPSWEVKGVGVSASLCSAFAAGLLKASGSPQNSQKIFLAAQSGDQVAHGGRASGIDAKTVSVGKPLAFRRFFSPDKLGSKTSKFSLPAKTSLLLIDTFNGKKDSTSDMLEKFASSFGIYCRPQDTPEKSRQKVQEEFSPIWNALGKAKTARSLGELMNENHSLLRARKVSGDSIEKAVSSALTSGAYGAKLTGGGGEGGAVLALFDSSSLPRAGRAISDSTGFSCLPIKMAREGARID